MTSPPNRIAIIIVTYESGEHIRACLSSLPLAAPEYQLHLIVIDNASRDDTHEQIRAALQGIPPARFTGMGINYAANLGFTAAVNQALAHVPEGAAVLFLNPDTVLPPASLSVLTKRLFGDEKRGVIAPQLRFLSSNQTSATIQPSCRRFPLYSDLFYEFTGLAHTFPNSARCNRWKMGDFDHRSSREVEQPQGACLLARYEVVKQVGLWDERFPLFFSDVDWCRRVRQAGWKIYFDAEIFIYHEQGASVKKVRPAAIWSSHVSFWRYFRKWKTSWRDEILSLAVAPFLFGAALLRIAWHYVKR